MSLAERRGLRLFTFCALYCAQGIPWGFMAIALPAYVSARGHDIAAVGGIAAMTTLPYTLKLVWAPLIDAFPSRRFGRRRPWIVFAQAMMVVTVAAMIFVPGLIDRIELLAWMVFIHTVFNAMQDVSVDALAVDLLDEDERGRTNGLMYGSKYFGGILGATGMSHLIEWFDLRTALAAQAAVLLSIMMLPLFLRERSGEPPPRARAGRAVKAWFRRVFGGRQLRTVIADGARDPAVRSALLGVVLMLGSSIGTGTLVAVSIVLYTQELGWKPEDYTNVIGGWQPIVGFGGSILGGFLADKVGHRRLAAIGMCGLSGGWVLWAMLEPYWHSHALVYSMLWIEPLFQSIMTVSLFALCMDIAWPQIAATQFAIYMAMINFSTTIGSWIAGRASEVWTYRGIYLVAAIVQLSFIVVLPFIDPHAVKRSRDLRTAPA